MIYRTEHPTPQFCRENFINLNGEWQFEIDNSKSGAERVLFKNGASLSGRINVPFCPQSKLSGVEHKDFMYCVWYKRDFGITPEQKSGRSVLHIGAADYEAHVYVNGSLAGTHRGGYVPFALDVSKYVKQGNNTLTVAVYDNERNPMIPRGKQSEEYYSHGCDYTRTTGIWQTVYLEFTPKTYIESAKYYPDAESAVLNITAKLCGAGALTAKAYYEGREAGSATTESFGGAASLSIRLNEKHLWEPGAGRLYDLVLTYGEDEVKSYFGLRNVCLSGNKFLLNGKSVFQRLILDQGFYPDGIYTAPSDEALLGDVLLSKAAGFNGARLHQKIFEPRFLYHCDREGYMVWGEYPSWGLDHSNPGAVYPMLFEWAEEIGRDFNHPSIIGWCPFNETSDIGHKKQHDDLIRMVYRQTKALDPTRPCIDTSGYIHVETDIFDIHDYTGDTEVFEDKIERFDEAGVGIL
ncbi:MAG: beta-galactosidase, partial [Oscillospiraceae bacterium]|nr:beta-galactosidase [Oscillospiraceae bacterium]